MLSSFLSLDKDQINAGEGDGTQLDADLGTLTLPNPDKSQKNMLVNVNLFKIKYPGAAFQVQLTNNRIARKSLKIKSKQNKQKVVKEVITFSNPHGRYLSFISLWSWRLSQFPIKAAHHTATVLEHKGTRKCHQTEGAQV